MALLGCFTGFMAGLLGIDHYTVPDYADPVEFDSP